MLFRQLPIAENRTQQAEELIRWLRANPRQASLAVAQEQLRRLREE
jgi:hypothetical protein